MKFEQHSETFRGKWTSSQEEQQKNGKNTRNVARNVENAARAVQHNATPHCSCRSLVDQLQDFVGAVNDNLLEVLQRDNAQQYEYTNFDRIQSVYVYIML
jgi:hypothetical protein